MQAIAQKEKENSEMVKKLETLVTESKRHMEDFNGRVQDLGIGRDHADAGAATGCPCMTLPKHRRPLSPSSFCLGREMSGKSKKKIRTQPDCCCLVRDNPLASREVKESIRYLRQRRL